MSIRRFAKFSGLFIACALVIAGCSTPEERAAAYTARAKELFTAGDLDKASLEARNAVQIQPKNAEAHYLLVQIAERKGEVGQMVSHLAVVIEEDPKNAAAKVKLGALLINAQDYDGARLLVDEVLALTPNDPGVHVLNARLALQKEDGPAAMASLDRALEIDARNVEAAGLRALVVALTDPQKALDNLSASIAQLGPKDGEVLRKLRVDLLARLGRNDEVEQELRSLIADYGTQVYYENLARFYTALERPEDAEAVLREAVGADPTNLKAKVDLAQYQSRNRQKPEEAERTLKAFIAESPDDLQLQVLLGNFYEGGNRNDEALAVYEKVAAAAPTSQEGLAARNRIAALLLRSGRIDEARQRLEGILEDQPDNLQALLARGEINRASGRNEEAVADLRVVLRREPDNPLALTLLAETHTAVGDRPLAEDAWRRLLRNDPRNMDALIGLAGLIGQGGQVDEAETLLKQALALQPQDTRALELMVGVALAKGDFKAAEQSARSLAEIGGDPKGVGQRELGRVLEAQQRFSEAVDAYRLALAKKPDSTLALEGAVRSLQSGNRLADATRLLEDHLEKYPDHVLARVLLGGNLLRSGNLVDARRYLEEAIQQQPQLARAYVVLSAAYPEDPELRIAVLKRGLDANPMAGNLAVLLASEYQRAGRIEDAIRLYESVLARNDAMPQVANNLAALLLDHRDDAASHKRALELAGRFSGSQEPMYLDTLGWAHYRNKDYDSAIRFLELAVAYGRLEPEARYHLAMAYLATDNTVGAKQELEKALKDSAGRAPWAAEARKTLDSLAAAPATPAPPG